MKKRILLLFILLASYGYAQHDSVLYKKYSYSFPKYSVYGFYDVVRFAGAGLEFRPHPNFSLDLKAGMVYPDSFLKSEVLAGDYFLNQGFGLILSPHLNVGIKKRFFWALNIGFYNYGYKGLDVGGGYFMDKSTFSYSIGPSIGYNYNFEKINIGIFLSAALENMQSQENIYPNYPYPQYFGNSQQANVLAGIKIGSGFLTQKLCSRDYYTKLLTLLISKENNEMIKRYRNGEINKGEMVGYEYFRRDKFADIKEAYKTYYDNNEQMELLVYDAESSILEFIRKNFNK